MGKEKIEYCIVCGEPTDKAGIYDDSNYLEDGEGPFCDSCYQDALADRDE